MAGQPGEGEAKKLREAAQFWAGAGDSDADAQSDAATFGMILEPSAPPEFEVWEENWDAVMMWMRVATQWRTTMDGPIGLDYSVLHWLFGLYDVEKPREMLEDLQIMEAAVLELRASNGAES